MAIITLVVSFLITLLFQTKSFGFPIISQTDVYLLEVSLNLEYFEAEFFLFGSLGYGLDEVAPNLTMGGPSPIGPKMAKLDPFIKDIILQFAYQEVGHLRAIKETIKGFPRPLMDLSSTSFGQFVDRAFGRPLKPPFDPYANNLNFLLASYIVPYVGLTGFVGSNPNLQSSLSKRINFDIYVDCKVGGTVGIITRLLGVESGQNAVIRTLLYEVATKTVEPYGVTVAEFTRLISNVQNKLGGEGIKDEGIVVPEEEGAEGKISGNVLVGDEYSLSYARTPEEVLRIMYGSGSEHFPGGFYPKGANGHIAKSLLGST